MTTKPIVSIIVLTYNQKKTIGRTLDKIQVQIDYLETHPECGMVHSDVDVFYPATQRTEHSTNKYHSRAIPSGFFAPYLLTTILPIYTPTPAYRKSLVDKVNFDEFVQNGFMMEDLSMWLEMSHFTNFHYIDQNLVTYTSADGSLYRRGWYCAGLLHKLFDLFSNNDNSFSRYTVRKNRTLTPIKNERRNATH